ncbi:RcnB family protein [Acinetobacter variabilis]|uniref:RcnB family protein n=1 Tax=Acinetobacter variabilis TaxID=70346 RepID=UPI003B83FA8B
MKKVLTTIALSLSALVATSAMAAPQHHDSRYAPHKSAPHWDHKDAKKWDDRRDDRRYNNRGVNPSRDWRVGQKLPNQYDNRRFEVSGYETRRLPKAGKNQQWYKINGDYVLVNDRNDKIVRIIN